MKSVKATVNEAEKALEQGNVAQAEKLAMQSLVTGPSGLSLALLGRIRMRQERLADAVPLLQKALQLQPGNVDAALDLVDVLRRQGKLQAAANIAQQVVKADSSQHRAWMSLALCIEQANGSSREDLERALGFARRAVALCTHNPAYLRHAAAIADKVANLEVLLALLESLHDVEPLEGLDRVVMLSAMVRCNRLHQAEHWYQSYFSAGEDLAADFQFASMLMRADRLNELVSFTRDMAHKWPEATTRWHVLEAKACHMLDGAAQGVAVARAALDADPGDVELLAQLAMIDAAALNPDERSRLEHFLESGGVNDNSLLACSVCFALAGLAEAEKDFTRQLALLHQGNALRKPVERYVPEEADARLEAMKKLFTPQWADVVEKLESQVPSPVIPVFVLCMPRSGTTLIEQILCSHSQASGIGEAGILHDALRGVQKELGLGSAARVYEASISEVAPVFRRHALDAFWARGVSQGVIVEKSMTNAPLAGLAYAAFPEARFIMAHRHPMDVAFGCYKQLFSAGEQSFSYDLTHCAHAYVNFMRLMELWQSLSGFPLLRVDYESLVGDFEVTVRAMLDFVGLPFEQACLQFHQNPRAVSTASANQVRQGLYTSAVGHWARYGDGLQPLREAFERYGVEIVG